MGARPPFRDELPLEFQLTFGQAGRVRERLDALDAVRCGHAQFARAVWQRPHLVSKKLASPLKPPKQDIPRYGRQGPEPALARKSYQERIT